MCHLSLDIVPNVGDDSLTFASFVFTFAGVLRISRDVCGTTKVHGFLKKSYVYLTFVHDGFQVFLFSVNSTDISLEYVKVEDFSLTWFCFFIFLRRSFLLWFKLTIELSKFSDILLFLPMRIQQVSLEGHRPCGVPA